jgi:hypothetical protein
MHDQLKCSKQTWSHKESQKSLLELAYFEEIALFTITPSHRINPHSQRNIKLVL